MEFGSFNGGKYEHNGHGLVEIFKMFMMELEVFGEEAPCDTRQALLYLWNILL